MKNGKFNHEPHEPYELKNGEFMFVWFVVKLQNVMSPKAFRQSKITNLKSKIP